VQPVEVLKAVRTGEGPVIIDARGANEYASGHIPGAINVPYKETWGRLEELRGYQERGIVFYCAEGVRAKIAGDALLVEGFRRVGTLDGSLRAWKQAGLPVEYSAENSRGELDE
jgi:rhodanese-related sulfurtransferase